MNRAQPRNRASGVGCTAWLDGRGRRAACGLGGAGHRRAACDGVDGAPAAMDHAPATAPRGGLRGHRQRPRQERNRTARRCTRPHAPRHHGGHARGRPRRGAPLAIRLPHPHGLDRRVDAGHPAAILPPRVAADDRATGRTRHAPSAHRASRSWPQGSADACRHPLPLRNPANRQALAAPLGTKIAPSPRNRASGVSCTPWLDGRGGRRAAPGLGRAGHRRTARHGVNGAPAATRHALATAPRAGLTGGTGRPRQERRPTARLRTRPHVPRTPEGTLGAFPRRGAPLAMRLPHPHGRDRRVGAGHLAAILPPRVATDDHATGRTCHAPSARPASRSWLHGRSDACFHPSPLRDPPNVPRQTRRWQASRTRRVLARDDLPKSRPGYGPRQRRRAARGCWVAWFVVLFLPC